MQLLYTIATKRIDFSRIAKATPEFQNFIKRLLHHDPQRRLGGGESDADELKSHPFFSGIDWNAIEDKLVPPPFKPNVEDERDTSNIDKSFLNERPVDSPVLNKLTNSQKAKAYFEKFTYSRDHDILLTT